MNPILESRLEHLAERFEELGVLLADPGVHADNARYTALTREFAELEALDRTRRGIARVRADIDEARRLRGDDDPDMRAMAEQSLTDSRAELAQLEAELTRLLMPKDPDDGRDVFLEIRAGTGGDEAALFAGDLFRMYGRYAEQRGWRLEILSQRPGEHGGFKEIITRVSGRDVYAALKFESGAHRVQRVPATESQGRIHSSACTVAILPEHDAVDAIEIDPGELRIDTFRSSGAGGQHVNTTDSAVRITHLPSGLVVECQDERSQHKNRARAMSLLSARLLDRQRSRQQAEEAETRRSLVGTGDRSDRIRTYNFPQGRVTDHRINLTLYKLAEFMEGQLDPVLEPLAQAHGAELLARMTGEPPADLAAG